MRTKNKSIIAHTIKIGIQAYMYCLCVVFFSYKFGECTRTLIGMGSMNAVGRNVRSIEVSK